jgi:hypothetical protein
VSADGSRIVGPAQLVGHAGESGYTRGSLSTRTQLYSRGSGYTRGRLTTRSGNAVAIAPAIEVDRALPIIPVGGRPVTPDSDRARELTAHEEGLRAILAAGAMQMAVTDWGWTGFDATLFALAVWCAVGWLLRQH